MEENYQELQTELYEWKNKNAELRREIENLTDTLAFYKRMNKEIVIENTKLKEREVDDVER